MNVDGHQIWSVIRSIVFIAIGLYLSLVIILTILQSRLIYFPRHDIVVTPDSFGLSYETVDVKTADNIRLHGWYIPATDSRGTILFCHGNAGNISHRMESIELFHRLGLDVFIFDYRGYGQSEGKPSERGTYLDGEAAWNYLTETRRTPSSEIIVFGRSLGGAVAAWIAQDHTPGALIVESAFTSIKDIGSNIYPFLPVRLLSRFDYDTKSYIQHVNCPVLIVHSREDEMISFSHGQGLFEAAKEPKEFLKITGTHNEGFLASSRSYEKGLDSFISAYIGK